MRFGTNPASEEYLWLLEQTVGGCAFRNVASGLLLSADRVLRADRAVAQHWESFTVTALSADQLAQPYGVPVVDPLTTQAVNARVRIRSVRYQRLIGLRGHAVRCSRHDTLWDLLASPDGEGYLIRNSAHPQVRCFGLSRVPCVHPIVLFSPSFPCVDPIVLFRFSGGWTWGEAT